MKRTLKNIVLGLTLAGVGIMGNSCKNQKLQNEHLLPKVAENQKLILDSNYVKGDVHLGYTLLTDIDDDQHWDVAKIVYVGRTPGNHITVYNYKEGYGYGQTDTEGHFQVHSVKPEFFKKYE